MMPTTVEPATEEELNLYEKVVLEIGGWHGIPYDALRKGALNGSYKDRPLDVIEFFLHELGHFVVLGESLRELPESLVEFASQSVKKLSQATSDSVELDTAVVTYLTGASLGLWTSPVDIMNSCLNNLIWTKLDEDDDDDLLTVAERFERNFRQRCLDVRLRRMARKTRVWFLMQAKLRR